MEAAGGDVGHIVDRILSLLGPKAAPVEERRGRVHCYEHALKMGDAGAIICHGGNNGTCLVSLSGEACALVQDWARVVELGRDEFQGRITRWDGAVDDYLGEHSVNLALQLWESNQFGAGGNQPSMRQAGNWHRPDGSGRTIYVGKGKNGKSLRVYEKGMQLGAPWHPWVRWELTYGSRDRIVPWEVLTEPGPYVAGGYPKALSWVCRDMSRVATIQKQTQIGYESLSRHASRAFGSFIAIMLKVEGSAERVVEKLQRVGTPRRLRHPFIDNPDEWLE
jgi:phage replication initiation protein